MESRSKYPCALQSVTLQSRLALTDAQEPAMRLYGDIEHLELYVSDYHLHTTTN